MGDKVRRPRRWWSEEFKRRVVAEAAVPGASAAAVARRYDLNANLLHYDQRPSLHITPMQINIGAMPKVGDLAHNILYKLTAIRDVAKFVLKGYSVIIICSPINVAAVSQKTKQPQKFNAAQRSILQCDAT